MNNSNPIGFFDSGVGGTSVWNEIVHLLPNEHTIYLADNANAPYGIKHPDQITELCIKNTELLINRQCKLIVVPCNTATTNSIAYLRQHYDLPFIGIEPAIKPAALMSQTNTIGILATKGTLSSELFNKTQRAFIQDVQMIEVTGTGIVELIESGQRHSPQMIDLLSQIIQPLIKSNIDYLVLGCSHYPYIKDILAQLLPDHVRIIDSGVAVANQTYHILKEFNLLNQQSQPGTHQLYANSSIQVLDRLTQQVDSRTVSLLSF